MDVGDYLLVFVLAISIVVSMNMIRNHVWKSISITKPSEQQIDPERQAELEFAEWKYLKGLGVLNSSTMFEGLSPLDLFKKCKLFGKNCNGFDTLGNLFLERNMRQSRIESIAQLRKNYAITDGLYMPKGNKYETTCQYFNRCETHPQS